MASYWQVWIEPQVFLIGGIPPVTLITLPRSEGVVDDHRTYDGSMIQIHGNQPASLTTSVMPISNSREFGTIRVLGRVNRSELN